MTTSSALPPRRPQELGGRTNGASHDHKLDHTDGGAKPGSRAGWCEDRASRKRCCRRPHSPSTRPRATQDASQRGRRGPADTPPQQLHLPCPAPPPGGRGDPRGGQATPAAPGGRSTDSAGAALGAGSGSWAGRVTDGGRGRQGLASGTCRAQSPWALPPARVTPRAGPAAEGGCVPRDPAATRPSSTAGRAAARWQGLGAFSTRTQSSFPPPAGKVTVHPPPISQRMKLRLAEVRQDIL